MSLLCIASALLLVLGTFLVNLCLPAEKRKLPVYLVRVLGLLGLVTGVRFYSPLSMYRVLFLALAVLGGLFLAEDGLLYWKERTESAARRAARNTAIYAGATVVFALFGIVYDLP